MTATGGELSMEGVTDPQGAEVVGRWTLVPEQSTVRFAERHFWGLITVRGYFASVNGEARVEPADELHVSVTLEAASANTGHPKRDGHLRGPDFFDAESHPTIDVTAVAVRRSLDDGTLPVSATVSAAGHPLPIDFDVTLDQIDGRSVTVRGSVTIDRRALGMRWSPLGMSKYIVTVDFELRFVHEPSRVAG